MVRAGAALSSLSDSAEAGAQAAAAARERAASEPIDVGFVFATRAHAGDFPRLVRAAAHELDASALVAATGHTVLADGREEDGRGAAVLALAGLEARPFLLPDLRGAEDGAGAEIAARVGAPLGAGDLVVILADADSLAADPLLRSLGDALGPAVIVGAGAVAAPPLAPRIACGGEVASGALAGVVLRSALPPRIGVTTSCRLVTEPFAVTRSEGHWILELDGRPALDVYREAARGPLAADMTRAASVLRVALERAGAGGVRWLVRNLAGFDPRRRAFAVACRHRQGQRLALALRDADQTREDLGRALEALAAPPPACGLYFSCAERGRALFGFDGLEAGYLQRSLPGAALAGLFGSCQFGPLGSGTELLIQSGVLALLDAPERALR